MTTPTSLMIKNIRDNGLIATYDALIKVLSYAASETKKQKCGYNGRARGNTMKAQIQAIKTAKAILFVL